MTLALHRAALLLALGAATGRGALLGFEDATTREPSGSELVGRDASSAVSEKDAGGDDVLADAGQTVGAMRFVDDFESYSLGPLASTKWQASGQGSFATFQISNDGSHVLDVSGDSYSSANPPFDVADFDLSVRAKLVPGSAGSDPPGVTIGFHAVVATDSGYTFMLYADRWELIHYDHGKADSPLARGTNLRGDTGWHLIRIQQVGATIQMWADGVSLATAVPSVFVPAGLVSLGSFAGRALFDDVVFTYDRP